MSRVLLTSKQFEQLAQEFIDELHKISLYDTVRKRRLASNYLKTVQSLIVSNICELEENCEGDPFASIKAQFLADKLLD
jgi:hypothetical protein